VGIGSICYVLIAAGVQIEVWSCGDLLIENQDERDFDFYIDQGYTEITRQEFVDAYIPINEKLNEKIGEL